jgi:uncharacterized protein (TIGR03382 family)
MRFLPGFAAFTLISTISVSAFANSGGVGGYSGKPNGVAPQGQTCSKCHTGGATPTVTLDGPTTIAAGQQAQYTITVNGTGSTAAAVAASDTATLAAGDGLRETFGELVQTAPQADTGTFSFTVMAPTTGSKMQLWYVGLGGDSQDNSAAKAAIQTISVTGGAPDPSETTTSSSSSSSGSTTTPAKSTAAKKTTKKSSGDDDDDASHSTGAADDGTQYGNSGCNAVGNADAGGIALVVAVLFGLRSRRRRRQ